MTLNRQFWKPPLRFLSMLPCPSCERGQLRLVQGSLSKEETRASRQAQATEESWLPEEEDGRFAAMLRCNECNEAVAVCGTTGVERYDVPTDEDYEIGYETTFYPRYFDAAPPIIRLPRQCPAPVRAEIARSFPLYWCDGQACANVIRTAIERVLDDQGVPIEAVSDGGKPRRLSLHDRIEAFDNPECRDLLLALKIVGNVGSHGDVEIKIRKDDLLSAYEIFEYLIERLYVKNAERVAQLAAELGERMKVAKKANPAT